MSRHLKYYKKRKVHSGVKMSFPKVDYFNSSKSLCLVSSISSHYIALLPTVTHSMVIDSYLWLGTFHGRLSLGKSARPNLSYVFIVNISTFIPTVYYYRSTYLKLLFISCILHGRGHLCVYVPL